MWEGLKKRILSFLANSVPAIKGVVRTTNQEKDADLTNLYQTCEPCSGASEISSDEPVLDEENPAVAGPAKKKDISVSPLMTENREELEGPSTGDIMTRMMYYNKHLDFYYISDIHLDEHIARKFNGQSKNVEIKSYIREITRKLVFDAFKTESQQGIRSIGNDAAHYGERNCKNFRILFGGDVAASFEIARVFYTEFMNQCKELQCEYANPDFQIYAVLGNHELWPFSSFAECSLAYTNLFEGLGICFLNNKMAFWGKGGIPTVIDPITKERVGLTTDEERTPYSVLFNWSPASIIVGGVGFAGYNLELNANNGLYKNALNRKEEMEETQKWEKVYHDAFLKAKECRCSLVVLTHNPVKDWKRDYPDLDNSCIYVNGHTHRNLLWHDTEANIHILADNQVGYKRDQICFKHASFDVRRNPFAKYNDGYHEISLEDYREFYSYIDEFMEGTKGIAKRMEKYGEKLFLLKCDGYYGFFLHSTQKTLICAGGCSKKLTCQYNNMEQLYADFQDMVVAYLHALSPYRGAQEKIANKVRSIGGAGTIHGCIIDINFFNHIMLNPNDGTVTYYYSPELGEIERYSTLGTLLHKQVPELEQNYKKYLKSGGSFDENSPVMQGDGETFKINIKNSIYGVSKRMNQLQRLFSKKVLRDWNNDLLLNYRQKKASTLELPE